MRSLFTVILTFFISIPIINAQLRVGGSSTVYPLSKALLQVYQKANSDFTYTIEFAGSTTGINELIRREKSVVNASRKIKAFEKEEPTKNGNRILELAIALDGITIIDNNSSHWLTDLTTEELVRIWAKDSLSKPWISYEILGQI